MSLTFTAILPLVHQLPPLHSPRCVLVHARVLMCSARVDICTGAHMLGNSMNGLPIALQQVEGDPDPFTASPLRPKTQSALHSSARVEHQEHHRTVVGAFPLAHRFIDKSVGDGLGFTPFLDQRPCKVHRALGRRKEGNKEVVKLRRLRPINLYPPTPALHKSTHALALHRAPTPTAQLSPRLPHLRVKHCPEAVTGQQQELVAWCQGERGDVWRAYTTDLQSGTGQIVRAVVMAPKRARPDSRGVP